MTGVKLSEIPGALVEKGPYSRPPANELDMTEGRSGYSQGWDSAVDIQGQISIGLNRERLAKTIHARRFGKDSWNIELSYIKKQYLKDADAIIAAQKDLLEVKND